MSTLRDYLKRNPVDEELLQENINWMRAKIQAYDWKQGIKELKKKRASLDKHYEISPFADDMYPDNHSDGVSMRFYENGRWQVWSLYFDGKLIKVVCDE